jgi:uncharacterized protein
MEEHTLKFLVDYMLGKLARYLRMLGVDTVYFTKSDLAGLIEKASHEKRIILSRNTKLKRIDGLLNFVFINDDLPDKQLREVLRYFNIHISADLLFTRCLTCNQKLVVANHEEARRKVPPYIFETNIKFFLCSQCKKIYWEGTHLKKMKEIILKVLEKSPGNDFIDA